MRRMEFDLLALIVQAYPVRNAGQNRHTEFAIPRMWAPLQYLPGGIGGESLLDVGSCGGLRGPAYAMFREKKMSNM